MESTQDDCVASRDAGCLQDSTWLIDPYWTLAPPMLALFWISHPAAALWNLRQVVNSILMGVWAARLTHSYFRREHWRAGAREDWRYADMKQRCGKWWPLIQVRSFDPHEGLVTICDHCSHIEAPSTPVRCRY